MSKKYDRYAAKKWVQWCGRILWDDSEELLKLARILKKQGHLQTVNKNTVLRFALLSLIKTLKKMKAKDESEIEEEQLKIEESQLKKMKENKLAEIERENAEFLKKQQDKLAQIGEISNVQMS